MRKFTGGLLAVIGLLWGVVGILTILVKLENWKRFDYAYSDWQLIWIIVLLFVVVGVLVCIIGIHLFRGRKGKESMPQTRTYYSSFKLKIVKFAEVLFFSLIVFFSISYYFLPHEWIEDVRYLSIMLISAFLFALCWAFYWRNITIEISSDGIRFLRRKREYIYYPLDMPFYSSVTKMRLNSIHIGTNREFHIPIEGNNYKRIPCWSITGRDFSQLVDDIDKLRLGGLFEQLESFDLPRSSLLAKKRRRMIVIATSTLVLGITLTVSLFFYYLEHPEMYAISILVAIVLFGSVMLFAIQLGLYFRLARHMPKRVVLTDFGIRMDEQAFPVNELKGVAMIPSSYEVIESKDLSHCRILLHTAVEHIEYQLGSMSDLPEDQVYDSYERLFFAIRDWCNEKNIPFG